MLNILVVLYKKKISESETINSIKKYIEEIDCPKQLMIWNNSPTLLSPNEIKELDSIIPTIIYGNDKKNTELSKIYTIIYESCQDDDILILFDHDTTIAQGFFKEALSAIHIHSNINLFLPIVKHEADIVSPSFSYGIKGVYWKKAKYGTIPSKHTTAINSGMIIRCYFLKHIFQGYNTKLKFYETDNDFMYKYSQKNKYLFVLKSEIYHSLGFYDDSVENKLKRFKAMKYGRITHMKSRGIILYYLAFIQYLFFGIKCAIKYKDFRFLYK